MAPSHWDDSSQNQVLSQVMKNGGVAKRDGEYGQDTGDIVGCKGG